MHYLIWLLCFFVIALRSRALETPNLDPFLTEMTTNLIAVLSNETKEYRPKSVREMMDESRRRIRRHNDGSSHYTNDNDRIRVCYMTYIAYRSALWDLKRYYEIRYLYTNNLDFEVGYLVHEIIRRYQVILELYQMMERRFMPYEEEHYAAVPTMLYVYINILEQCKEIVHLINMMHELESKYMDMEDSGVFGVTEDSRVVYAKESKAVSKNILKEHSNWQKWTQDKQIKKQRQQKLWQKQRQKSTSIPNYKTTPWTHKDRDIIYGWSIEDWWQMSDETS